MHMKFMHMLTRKKANMSLETMRMSFKMVMISAGSATVAPARSSFKMIWTGLNHQRF